MKLLVRLLLAFALFATLAARAELLPGDWSREDKALALNLGAATLALGWGAWSWDWGASGPRFQDEGWFRRDTGEGGADKLGHAWSAYALSHLFANRYEAWGYGRGEAARYGALSGVGLMGLVEVGDAFSDDYGFSYQDMLFNTLGAALGYVLWQYPEVQRKIDFRVEYNPFRRGGYQADVFTDYDRLKYLIAVKADGFDAVRDPLLRHLEFHVGFYARNYADHGGSRSADLREQHLYVGIGLNLTRLLDPYVRTGGVLHYIQPPYTYVPVSRRVDR